MQNIIQKAIEGGWKSVCGNCQESWFGHKQTRIGNRYCMALPDLHKTVCDPSFWQSFGKACGWEKTMFCAVCGNGTGIDSDERFMPEWQYHALRFHEINLTEGWDKAVAYLEDLIK